MILPIAATATECPADVTALAFPLDRGHSNVVFRIKHFDVGYVYGMFALSRGTFLLDPANDANSKIEATVRAASINTNHAKRDEHLKSAELFNVEKFAHISFVSTKITHKGGGTYNVRGDLTLLGKTHSIELDIKDMGCTWMDHADAFQRGITGQFTIDRTKFGMESAHFLGDEVEIWVSLEGGASPKEGK